MTAYINKLKDKTGNQQLPVTHERAVRDDNGTTAETKFQNLEGAMDKAYVAQSDNGMGRITLKKNMVSGVNTLTQSMMQATNTIYIIRYDYTLGEDITVPENCVLEFDGGSVSGAHTLTGNTTGIQSELIKIFNTDVTIAGSWNVAEAYPEWFGAKGDGTTDDTEASQKCATSFQNTVFTKKYKITTVIFTDFKNCILRGEIYPYENGIWLYSFTSLTGNGTMTVPAVNDATGVTLGRTTEKNRRIVIDGIKIQSGFADSKNYGIKCLGNDTYYNCTCFIKNVSIFKCYYGFYGDIRNSSIDIDIEQCADNFDIGGGLNTINIIGQASHQVDDYEYFAYLRYGDGNNVKFGVYDVGISDYQKYLISCTREKTVVESLSYPFNEKNQIGIFRDLPYLAGTVVENPNYSISVVGGGEAHNRHLTKNIFKQDESFAFDFEPTTPNDPENPLVVTIDLGTSIQNFIGFEVIYQSANASFDKVEIYNGDVLLYRSIGNSDYQRCFNRLGYLSHALGNIKIILTGTGSVIRIKKCTLYATYSNNSNEVGTTRPVPPLVKKGDVFFDESLSTPRPIWWNGTQWVDATGTTV